MASVHVALLRGINVGGKNRLPMRDLVAMFRAVGCSEVQSYIQSGNIIFRASQPVIRRVPALITQAISDRFDLRVPVVTRTAEELREIVDGNPFLREGADQKALCVAFLAHIPEAARVASLDPSRSPPDAFSVHGREVYLHCPNGFARTRLTTDYFDTKLATTSTMRNWRTVLEILELTGG
jgi:uncharacterized protein (DUF1697 family)